MKLRSVLFVPAANTKALQKALGLKCDAIIYDLEDSVFYDHKTETLGALVAHILANRLEKPVWVRLNAKNGRAEAQRLKHLVEAGHLTGFVIPKVGKYTDLLAFADMNVPLVAMIETALGVVNLKEITAQSVQLKLKGLILGPNDLRYDLGASALKSRQELAYAMGAIVMHAKAHGLFALDGVYNVFEDHEGLLRECAQAKSLGFDGKTLIHPAQIDVANRAFGPSLDERDWALKVIAAFDNNPEKSVLSLDGEMVELMHLAKAHSILSEFAA